MVTYEELFLYTSMLIAFAMLIYKVCKDKNDTKK